MSRPKEVHVNTPPHHRDGGGRRGGNGGGNHNKKRKGGGGFSVPTVGSSGKVILFVVGACILFYLSKSGGSGSGVSITGPVVENYSPGDGYYRTDRPVSPAGLPIPTVYNNDPGVQELNDTRYDHLRREVRPYELKFGPNPNKAQKAYLERMRAEINKGYDYHVNQHVNKLNRRSPYHSVSPNVKTIK